MSMLQMTIKRWQPRQEPEWRIDQHGARVARIEETFGVVEVFSFPGNEQHAPFTTLTMWIDPYRYHARFPRHYHDRWIRRLTGDFACQCYRMSKENQS